MVTAQESCENVLLALKSSNLNFLIQESPYSVYITVRKRFLKNSPQPKKVLNSASHDATNCALELEISELKKELEAKNTRCTDIEIENELLKVEVKKLNKMVTNVTQVKNEKENELKVINNLHKNVSNELQKVKTELKVLSKNIKSKEKEIYSLDNKNENLQDTIARIKTDNAALKKDKKFSEKKRNIVKNKKEDPTSTNNNFNCSSNFSSILSSNLENPGPPIQLQSLQVPDLHSLSPNALQKDSPPSPSYTPPGTPPPSCSEPSNLSSPANTSSTNAEDIIKFAERFNIRMEEQTQELMSVIKESFKLH